MMIDATLALETREWVFVFVPVNAIDVLLIGEPWTSQQWEQQVEL